MLLTTCAPPVRLKVFTFARIFPALPAPAVATEILPPSATVNVGVDTAICPAFPVLEAVLKMPLLGSPVNVMLPTPSSGPTPLIVTAPGALIVMLPPAPVRHDLTAAGDLRSVRQAYRVGVHQDWSRRSPHPACSC